MTETPLAVEMIDITRRFARALANDRVSLKIRKGEVHALVGENGAGKSTLMKLLGGLFQPDSGEIRIDGQPHVFRSPAGAIAAGIGMVHQHFMLIPPFTVTENIILGEEGGAGLAREKAAARVTEISKRYRINVDPNAKVEDLSVGEQQRVEILKVLFRNARIIILDEPTAVLTPQEVDEFFVTVGELRSAGNTIIIITHKLREVMALSDNLTILRAGRNVASLKTSETSPEEIAKLMVGRDVILPTLAHEIEKVVTGDAISGAAEQLAEATPIHHEQESAIVVKNIILARKGAVPVLKDVSFSIEPGEVLGIAGVEGNGQAELVDVLTGLRMPTSGTIQIAGQDVTHFHPREKFSAGLACIPEDRHGKGLVLDFSLKENLLLGRHHSMASRRAFAGTEARRMLDLYDVRPPNPRAKASQLSGGNQQKVIVAREFTRRAKVLIASQPTRGVDLGAIEFIHKKLLELRAADTAILLVSAELSEILALSDRVAVMYAGSIVFTAPNKGLTEHDLGIYMAGGKH